jgi:hypothetical protein
MKVYLTEFYMNPRFYFDVSHRVYKYFNSCINKTIRVPSKADDTLLWIILDTKRLKKTKIEKRIKWGPRNKSEYKIVAYLPYEPLKKSRNFQYDFVDRVCDAVVEILKDYDIPEKHLIKIKEQCLAEVPGNPKYIFDDEKL